MSDHSLRPGSTLSRNHEQGKGRATPGSLPTGTVTFLFTDIEGSTKLWERYPNDMKNTLPRHDELLRNAIEANEGYVFKTVGDQFCATFDTAVDALSAVLDAQNALTTESWDKTDPIRVRMALHTGAADERDGDYFGPPVNRVARLLSAGHGGQTLLSQPTFDLVRDELPEGVSLIDLGEHRLKDLSRPEQVFQIVATDVPDDFPSLKTLDICPNNLFAQPTLLIGRDKEMETAKALLLQPNVRLLTLTGVGGAGKTRLGLQVAADLIDHFEDGVYFVDLAPISDPDLILSALAQTLGIKESEGHPLRENLVESLRDKQMLIMLDNFEQLVNSIELGVELLRACPRVKLLVTSREALNVRHERVFPVPPLTLPDLDKLPSTKRLSQYEAVQLFIERALAVKPDFEVTNKNARAIAEICVELDGLPLAIELAAARIRLLSPQAILSRLENRLKLLTGGPRDLPPRQRTLRTTIDWSHDLLGADEQALLRRLSVFVGGCTLGAAEAVCADVGELDLDLFDGVTSLVDKNLLVQNEGEDEEPRFTMFETIREYGLDRLERSGEAKETRRAHAEYYLGLAEEGEPKLNGPEKEVWLDPLEEEHDNLRTALEWFKQSEEIEEELRLAGALGWFWSVRGYLSEGREWLEGVLKRGIGASAARRAKALLGAGNLARDQGDYERAVTLLEESLNLFRDIGDQSGMARAYYDIGWAYYRQDQLEEARKHFTISLEMGQESGDSLLLARTGLGLGLIDWRTGQIEEARIRFEESQHIFSDFGDRRREAQAVGNLGVIYYQIGDLDQALSYYQQARDIQVEIGDVYDLCFIYHNIGELYHKLGKHTQAAHYYEQVKQSAHDTGHRRMFSRANSGLADVYLSLGDSQRALEHAQEAQQVAERIGSGVELGVSYRVLGEVHLALGQVEQAKTYFEQSIPLLEEAREDEELAKARRGHELTLSRLVTDS